MLITLCEDQPRYLWAALGHLVDWSRNTKRKAPGRFRSFPNHRRHIKSLGTLPLRSKDVCCSSSYLLGRLHERCKQPGRGLRKELLHNNETFDWAHLGERSCSNFDRPFGSHRSNSTECLGLGRCWDVFILWVLVESSFPFILIDKMICEFFESSFRVLSLFLDPCSKVCIQSLVKRGLIDENADVRQVEASAGTGFSKYLKLLDIAYQPPQTINYIYIYKLTTNHYKIPWVFKTFQDQQSWRKPRQRPKPSWKWQDLISTSDSFLWVLQQN